MVKFKTQWNFGDKFAEPESKKPSAVEDVVAVNIPSLIKAMTRADAFKVLGFAGGYDDLPDNEDDFTAEQEKAVIDALDNAEDNLLDNDQLDMADIYGIEKARQEVISQQIVDNKKLSDGDANQIKQSQSDTNGDVVAPPKAE